MDLRRPNASTSSFVAAEAWLDVQPRSTLFPLPKLNNVFATPSLSNQRAIRDDIVPDQREQSR